MTAQQAYEAYQARAFFSSLDGLRAVCVLLVMWHHSPALTALEMPPTLLLRGFSGVDFFFVLSGYLITTLLLREEARRGRFSLRKFYLRRVLRIVPVYAVVVAMMAVYYIGVKGQTEMVALLPYYALFLSNFLIDHIPNLAPTWSLSVEEQFYILWPALLLLLPARAPVRLMLLAGLLLFCLVVDEGLVQIAPLVTQHAIFVLPTPSFAAILLGAVLALLLQTPRGFGLVWGLVRFRAAPLGLALVLLILWQVLPDILYGWPNLLMHGTMTLLLAALVVREDHWARPVMTWRPMARMGEISYGIYLYHLIGLQIARSLLAPLGLDMQQDPWLITLAFVAVTVLISEISFRTFESYFLSLKRRFA